MRDIKPKFMWRVRKYLGINPLWVKEAMWRGLVETKCHECHKKANHVTHS